MTLFRDNMETIPEAGVVVDEGQYRFRISKVDEKVNEDTGAVTIAVQCKIQDEGTWLGETVFLNCSLEKFGLRVLKTLYAATGYKPGPDGHDPTELVDREFRGTVVHKDYKGQTFANITPQSIESIY